MTRADLKHCGLMPDAREEQNISVKKEVLNLCILLRVWKVGNMFRSNVSSKFLYFVCKVSDENTGKVSTRVNGWQYFRWKPLFENRCDKS